MDISGGAVVSHNAGISTSLTGPDPLINGQTYDAAPVYTDFTTGKVTTKMMMGARANAGRYDFGILSYRDWHSKWHELRLRPNAEVMPGNLLNVIRMAGSGQVETKISAVLRE